MAKIQFQGFVEEVVSGPTGAFALKTAEPHRRQVDGRWETTARTFRQVKASRESGVVFDVFSKGDRVTVFGTEKTETREYQGKKYFDLVVWADRIEVERAGAQRPQEASGAAGQPDAGSSVPDSAPWDTPWDAAPPADDPWPSSEPSGYTGGEKPW